MEKKVILSTVAGFVTMFLAGWVLFGMILQTVMAKWQEAIGTCGNIEPSMTPMIVAHVALSLLLALLIYKLGQTSFMGGAKTAAWVSVLLVLWYDGWMFATFPFMTLEMSMYDVIGNTLVNALAGGVIGLVQSKV